MESFSSKAFLWMAPHLYTYPLNKISSQLHSDVWNETPIKIITMVLNKKWLTLRRFWCTTSSGILFMSSQEKCGFKDIIHRPRVETGEDWICALSSSSKSSSPSNKEGNGKQGCNNGDEFAVFKENPLVHFCVFRSTAPPGKFCNLALQKNAWSLRLQMFAFSDI